MKKEDLKDFTKDEIIDIFVDLINEMENTGNQYKEHHEDMEMYSYSAALLTRVNKMRNLITHRKNECINFGNNRYTTREAYQNAISDFKKKHDGDIPVSFEGIPIGKIDFLDDKLEKVSLTITTEEGKKIIEGYMNKPIGVSSRKPDSYIYVSIYNEDHFSGLQVPITLENVIRHLNNNSTKVIDCIFDDYDDFKSYELDCSQYAREESKGIKKITSIDELKKYFNYNSEATRLLEKF